jgi:hypothetical protein
MRTRFHVGSTVSVGFDHGFLVIAHPHDAPSKEDWEYVCRAIREYHAAARGQLVLTFGGVPDAAQRKRALMELPEGFVPQPVAVLTDSIAVRGVMTALNWLLNDNHRAFALTDAAGAAQHLGIPLDQSQKLAAFAHDLMPSAGRKL